ncbi:MULTISPECIES: hypothetical protein [unclassified Spirosoma]|uniref:hypothetical protein n=1 Tax=unclassified Spirosoma TaxID=2621999 RepID=UPI00096912E1|nr:MULTISPECIES: hypothetical protein [unclassified Spirosoma]MBN8821895.1 hypothetical protein [Spirosoma sp.]OJW80621.1 MAG: hypothetical protein BGO59_34715 [Spirosoma sp. 48-14]
MKSRVIFASLILGLGLAISQANAATTTNTDDSPAANKPASTMLVNGSQKNFASYVEQNIAKYSNTTTWQNFMSVVSLYNQNPAAVLNLSADDRAKFNEAAALVKNKLAKRNDAVASHWMNQAGYTARMINFLWDANQSLSQAADIQ